MANDSTVKKLPTRNEVPVEETWRLEDIFQVTMNGIKNLMK